MASSREVLFSGERAHVRLTVDKAWSGKYLFASLTVSAVRDGMTYTPMFSGGVYGFKTLMTAPGKKATRKNIDELHAAARPQALAFIEAHRATLESGCFDGEGCIRFSSGAGEVL